METINVAEAKSHLSELLSRVSAGERFLMSEKPNAAAFPASVGYKSSLPKLIRG